MASVSMEGTSTAKPLRFGGFGHIGAKNASTLTVTIPQESRAFLHETLGLKKKDVAAFLIDETNRCLRLVRPADIQMTAPGGAASVFPLATKRGRISRRR